MSDFEPGEHRHHEDETADGTSYVHANCRELQFVEGRMPLHDGSACGPTDDREKCACGCSAYNEFCARCFTPKGLNP